MKKLLSVIFLFLIPKLVYAQVQASQVNGTGFTSNMFSPTEHISQTLYALPTPSTILATTINQQPFTGTSIPAGKLNPGDTFLVSEVGTYTTPNISLTLLGTFTPMFLVNGLPVLTGSVPAQLPVNTAGTCSFDCYVFATVIQTGTSGSIRLDGWLDIQLTAGSYPVRIPLLTSLVSVDTTRVVLIGSAGVFSVVQSGESVTINQMHVRLN